MDINVLGFNQEKVLEIKNIKIEKRKNTEKEITQTLGIDDLYLLKRLFKFRGSTKTANRIIDGKVFFWINYKTLLKNMPILNMTKESLMNKFKKYVDMKLIERIQVYEKDGIKGTYSYMYITEKLEDLQIDKSDLMDSGGNDDIIEVMDSTQQGVPEQHDRGYGDDVTAKNGKDINGKDIKGIEKKEKYQPHSQNETYRTKEMENRWREEGLKEFEYPPVEEMSEAIKIFNIAKIFQAIERLGKSSYWKTKVDIDTFFNPINNYKWIRKAFNGGYDDFEEYDEPITQEIKSQDELEKRMQESDDFGDLLNRERCYRKFTNNA